MYPGHFAETTPEKPAAIHAVTGEVLTYRDLDDRSNSLSRYLFEQGLRRGDHIAVFMENNLRFFEVCWAALRSGLYVTTINRYLTVEEVAYIVEDSGARALFTTHEMASVAKPLPAHISGCPHRLMADGAVDGWKPYENVLEDIEARPLDEQWIGAGMLYSSGTTGRPKGIVHSIPEAKVTDLPAPSGQPNPPYGFGPNSIYLSPAPLYHAAPFGFTINIQRVGGTVVVMPRFDALDALRCIEEFAVTHSQWVPTMFVRMLKLPDKDRARYNLSSHECAIHAAAPCPVDVKKQMIEWWGPIIEEYYAGTEGIGSTRISSMEWLEHPGSVGQTKGGEIHICDENGIEQPLGQPGIIYFAQQRPSFHYHHAPEKTRDARHPEHENWSTLGDIGYLDADGYLFLTDRRSFMIVSGGVNIYPQEIENALIMHPSVFDVAVFGVPNEDFGEEVKAVVQVAEGVSPSPQTADDLLEFTAGKIAKYMVPKSIDFIDEMPRLPTGKLYKRLLRDRYWGQRNTRII